jgi:ParB family chromosome partitioning protein
MIDDPSVQLHVRDIIIAQGLTVREAEKLAGVRRDSKTKAKKKGKVSQQLSPGLNDILENLKRLLATQVRLKGNEKKGKIEIDYYSSEDLDRIIRVIRGDL